MMYKRKKAELALAQSQALALEAEVPQTELFLDNLVKVVGNFGFQQILLPPMEERKIFLKDQVLQKHFGTQLVEIHSGSEMVVPPTYLFSVLKKYLQNFQVRGPHVSKWFYVAPLVVIRNSKPAADHEFGLFVMGEDSPLANTQLINTISEILGELGVPEFLIELNSLGCRNCQKEYQGLLVSFLERGSFDFCHECRTNATENPLATWLCKNSRCREIMLSAPQIVDSLDDVCKSHFMRVLEHIDELSIPYTLNPLLSGPLAKERVVFSVSTPESAGSALGQGGNYASWAEYLGHAPSVPLIGFLTTFEKLWSAVPLEKRRASSRVEVFMVPLGEIASRRAMVLYRDLQHAGVVTAEAMLGNTGIKNQLKEAVERRCEIALIIGQKEALDETVILRDMRSGMQEVLSHDKIIDEVKKRLGK